MISPNRRNGKSKRSERSDPRFAQPRFTFHLPHWHDHVAALRNRRAEVCIFRTSFTQDILRSLLRSPSGFWTRYPHALPLPSQAPLLPFQEGTCTPMCKGCHGNEHAEAPPTLERAIERASRAEKPASRARETRRTCSAWRKTTRGAHGEQGATGQGAAFSVSLWWHFLPCLGGEGLKYENRCCDDGRPQAIFVTRCRLGDVAGAEHST
jgi:hypothetical protein